MKTSLLTIPSKKTEEVSWVKPLNNYLLSIYGNTSAYQTDITSFEKLRQDIRGVHADNTGLRLYFKYYSQLEVLDVKIQFSVLNKSKKLDFVWHDAFSPEITHGQNALPFEKANVLFNIGALLAKFAITKYNESQSSNGAATVKDAIVMLQQAAGIYEYLNENFLHAPSDDLSQSTIRFLSKLSLAQAQEVFTLNAITNDLDQSKNSLIAKLCKSTSLQYEECYNMISQDEKESFQVVDDYDDVGDDLDVPGDDEEDSRYVNAQLDPSWISIIYFKTQYYKSLSLYFHALQLESGRKYGDAIGFLNQSKALLENISPHTMKTISKGHGNVYDLLDNYNYQKDAVGIKSDELTKDNDLIYHDLVKKDANWNQLSPLQVSKVVLLNDIPLLKEVNEQGYQNFLSNVVPINIHELSSFYSEEKSQLLRNEIDYYEVSKEETESFLESLKLPKTLYQIKQALESSNDDEIPNEVVSKVSAISSAYEKDQEFEAENVKLRQKIYETIVRFDPYSHQDEAINLKRALYEASNSDKKISSLIEKSFYKTLSKGPNAKEFRQLFEPASAPEVSLIDKDDSQEQQIKVMENFFYDLGTIKAKKANLIERLKKDIHADDISNILMINAKQMSNNEIKSVIFPAELKKFQPFIDNLDNLITREKSILADVKAEWSRLLSDPVVRKLQTRNHEKAQLLNDNVAKINSFYDNWTQYHAGLEKGNTWYTKLLQHCEEIANASSLNKSMNSMRLNDHQDTTLSGGTASANTTGGQWGMNYGNTPYAQVSPSHNAPPIQPQFSGFNSQPLQPQTSSSQQSFPPSMPQLNSQPSYSRPPQLPPKNVQNTLFSSRAATAPSPGSHNQEEKSRVPPWSQGNKSSDSKSGLIYDQPSTYDPNMYDFFSK
ncbi:BRO1 [Candida margitis]|uniref:BRO1 n=1 Tax=Candida margitis TaxID=1775924 RepID=UPI002225E9F3|nr:BRO1 [Candida margitis]KAI5967338.1 BRO1 [Candida margitis]